MSKVSPKRFQLYCTNDPDTEEERETILGEYNSFLQAAIAINEIAETALNTQPGSWTNVADFMCCHKARVYDTKTTESIWIRK